MSRPTVAVAVADRRPRHLQVMALAAVLVVLVSVTGWVAARPADGQSAASLVLRRVDTRNPAESVAQFIYTGNASDVAGAQLSENGNVVDTDAPRALPGSTPESVALVFDTADAMDGSSALVEAKEAAKQWVRGRTAEQQATQAFAVFVASDKGVQIQDFTTDTTRIVNAIDRIGPASTEEARQQSALWSAVRQAADGLAERSGQPNLVIMSGTNDNVTGADRAGAAGAVTASGATVFAAQLTSAAYNPASVQNLVGTNGGLLLSTDQGTQFGDLVEDIAAAVGEQQYEVRFDAGVAPGAIADLTLQVGGQTATGSVVVGSDVQGLVALSPQVKPASGGISALQGNLGLVALVLVVLAAVGLLAYAVFMIFVREDRLAKVLQPYDHAVAVPGEDDDLDTSFARTAIVQRAVQITEQVAQERGFLVRAEHALERANLPLRAGEALFFYAAVVVIVTILALVLTGSLIVGLIAGVIFALVPVAVVNFLGAQRRKQFMALLPDTLSLLSGTLRAGYSLMQGVEAVSREVAEPMGQELRRVVTEARLGRPLEEALDGTAERMASPDFAWAVMAIRIQREVGGNLSELLLTVADTMVQRERLRRDVASLTAEGRMSAIILGLLPPGLGAVMFVMNPDYASKLLSTGIGNVLLGVALVAMLIGFTWMKKIITIEI
jgi:tight adherence protein B